MTSRAITNSAKFQCLYATGLLELFDASLFPLGIGTIMESRKHSGIYPWQRIAVKRDESGLAMTVLGVLR